MAVPTKYDVTFGCGHTETRDLSAKPAGKRKEFVNWLSTQDECTECWKTNNRDEINQRRLADALENQKPLGLPDLEGTDKQLSWAPIFRNTLIMRAHEDLTEGEDAPMSEDEFETRILDPARKITRAGWWMDNSDSESEDLEELVTTALDAEHTTENPF